MLGTRDPLYTDTVDRFHAMYFLGTPHRGSDMATYVKLALSLQLPSGSKPYVNELMPNSSTVQAINDDFRHVSHELEIWSFWEAKQTAGFHIVPKDKAVMGLFYHPSIRTI